LKKRQKRAILTGAVDGRSDHGDFRPGWFGSPSMPLLIPFGFCSATAFYESRDSFIEELDHAFPTFSSSHALPHGTWGMAGFAIQVLIVDLLHQRETSLEAERVDTRIDAIPTGHGKLRKRKKKLYIHTCSIHQRAIPSSSRGRLPLQIYCYIYRHPVDSTP